MGILVITKDQPSRHHKHAEVWQFIDGIISTSCTTFAPPIIAPMIKHNPTLILIPSPTLTKNPITTLNLTLLPEISTQEQ